jgi:hypothetical protein
MYFIFRDGKNMQMNGFDSGILVVEKYVMIN